MDALSAKMKIVLFLYSTKNLVGCILALMGLGGFFFGLFQDWWFPITAGLYAVGWLAVPADESFGIQIHEEATMENWISGLDELIQESKHKLPHEALNKLHSIQEMVVALAPKLFSGTMAMDYAISMTNAINRDLPETVENYMRLPPVFATLYIVDQGKTCKQLLLEQLDFLNEQLTKIAENVYKADAEALVVNGNFLKEKFHAVSFVK